MITYSRKITVRLRPEWDMQLQKLQKNKFPHCTQVEILRFLIKLGLNAFEVEKAHKFLEK